MGAKTLLNEFVYMLGLDIKGLQYLGISAWFSNVVKFLLILILVIYFLLNLYPVELTNNELMNQILSNLDIVSIICCFIWMIVDSIIWWNYSLKWRNEKKSDVYKIWILELFIPLMILVLFIIENNVDDDIKSYIKLLKFFPAFMLWNIVTAHHPSGYLTNLAPWIDRALHYGAIPTDSSIMSRYIK